MNDTEIARSVTPVDIEDEMRHSYMEYAMSVIVGRALPDVRDGLKPVHRRILYAMKKMGNEWNKPYKKSARLVGDVIGKYHPHGDTAVYDTMVRMAQSFSLRYMLIDGQGNFGSVDGDSPAAMRYTEVRMARIAQELLGDIDKDTVDFTPNYDSSEQEPVVLPARIPNLLINGSSGIAVGMATNVPPHNLSEIINAISALIDNPDLTTRELMQFIPGPDFPTAAFINGSKGIFSAYETGRGKIYIRARTHVEIDDKDSNRIIVTELPYQVNKARLIEKIADLVKDKKISGIRELRDESDKDGMRIVIELRKGEIADVLLNNLYQHTQMQSVFGINIVVLEGGRPRVLNLQQLLTAFITHRREIVIRRTRYDLRKSRARMHILEGLAVSLANIDAMIDLIKKSPTPQEAKQKLLQPVWDAGAVEQMLNQTNSDVSLPEDLPDGYGLVDNGYRLSEVQVQAILDLKLQRLTGLEQGKIIDEYHETLKIIIDLLDILLRKQRLMEVIKEELEDIRDRYGNERLTEILEDKLDLSMEDMIAEENVVVTFSYAGYAKYQTMDTYRTQRRGGKGKASTNMKDEDFIDKLFIANTHDTLLCFSSRGKLYCLKVYQLPHSSRLARGQPLVNLLPLEKGERINAVLPIREFSEDKFIVMATAGGTIKKSQLTNFSRPRSKGLKAIGLSEGDQLIGVELTDGHHDIMLLSSAGQAVRFNESKIRVIGRTARGVRGIRLSEGQRVNSMIVVSPDDESSVLIVTENGYGKRTAIKNYPVRNRGGKGVISIQTSKRNGCAIGAVAVKHSDEIMLISDQGTLIRTSVSGVSVVGRNTQGVRLIKLREGEHLVALERILEL